MTIQHNKDPASLVARPAIPPQVAVEKLITEKKKENEKEKRKYK